MESLNELLEEQLKDLYSAEKQLVAALPEMAAKASIPALQDAIESHLQETKGHVQRLESIAESLEIELDGKSCRGMQGLIEEGKEILSENGAALIIDAAIVAAAQRVEHYEISAYGSACAIAECLGHSEAMDLLQQTLDEEKAADEQLTIISTEELLPEAAGAAEEEEEDIDTDDSEDEDDEADDDDEDENEEDEDIGSANEQQRPVRAPAARAGTPRSGARTPRQAR